MDTLLEILQHSDLRLLLISGGIAIGALVGAWVLRKIVFRLAIVAFAGALLFIGGRHLHESGQLEELVAEIEAPEIPVPEQVTKAVQFGQLVMNIARP